MRVEHEEIEALRRDAERHRQRRQEAGRRIHWPVEFRGRVVGLMVGGMTAHELSRTLGINRRLLRAWRKQHSGKSIVRADFSEVSVVSKRGQAAGVRPPTADASDIVLTCPGGAYVSGLNFHQISTLLEAGLL